MEITQISAAVNIPSNILPDVAMCLGFTFEGGTPEEFSETDIAQMKAYLAERMVQNIKNEMHHYEDLLLSRYAEQKKAEIAVEFAGVISTSINTVTA